MIKIREIQTISEEEVPWLAPSYIHSDCRCLGAFEDACAGIILYEIKERILYIRYVYVREELRGQGIGGMLFQELQELAQREAPEGMIVSGVVPREQQSAMVRFFMQYGFMVPENGESIATVSTEAWRDSYLAGIPVREKESSAHIYSMTELPHELEYDYRNRVRSAVLPCCRVENVKGTLLPEYSLAYEYQGKIGAYILMTDVDGILYLNSVYISEKNAVFFVPLLKHCFMCMEKKGYPYKTMKITMFSDESRWLFQRLVHGMEAEIENQITMCRLG